MNAAKVQILCHEVKEGALFQQINIFLNYLKTFNDRLRLGGIFGLAEGRLWMFCETFFKQVKTVKTTAFERGNLEDKQSLNLCALIIFV
ncbi:MAG TPA: hypothetical protein ENJ95_03370 [Bacteroidetes bacterium]|nr:hypothetical protein [Bacteroidota bacterium]